MERIIFVVTCFLFCLVELLNATTVPAVTTIAGIKSHSSTFYRSGIAATSTILPAPRGVFVNSRGDLYIADAANYYVHKVLNGTGILKTVAGTGTSGISGNNIPATSAMLYDPYALFVDTVDNIYIVDKSGHKIRLVTNTTGLISTVAGTGSSGWNGKVTWPATSFKLSYPCGVWVDTLRNVYIADSYNNRIRKVTFSSGNITTVAGGGIKTDYNNTAATSAALSTPSAIFGDTLGYLYISDSYNYRISKITPPGKIYFLIGTGLSPL